MANHPDTPVRAAHGTVRTSRPPRNRTRRSENPKALGLAWCGVLPSFRLSGTYDVRAVMEVSLVWLESYAWRQRARLCILSLQ